MGGAIHFARKYMYEKSTKYPNFLHDVCPQNARSLHNICPENIFPELWRQLTSLPSSAMPLGTNLYSPQNRTVTKIT